jgi:hypothetical protein
MRGYVACRERDHDRVVPRKHQINQDDGDERREEFRRKSSISQPLRVVDQFSLPTHTDDDSCATARGLACNPQRTRSGLPARPGLHPGLTTLPRAAPLWRRCVATPLIEEAAVAICCKPPSLSRLEPIMGGPDARVK